MVATNVQVFNQKPKQIPPRIAPLVVIPENIPEDLKSLPNWVCWMYELRRNGRGEWKWTKPPIQVTSKYAQSNRPDTWLPFAPIYSHYREPVGWMPDGIGFHPTGDVVATDLDHCRNPATGVIDDWAW